MGIVGHPYVEGAAPDGCKLPYDPLEDFLPVILPNASPMFLVTSSDTPVHEPRKLSWTESQFENNIQERSEMEEPTQRRRRLAKVPTAKPIAAAASDSIAQAAESMRIYVLVHGAFHGGWCWKRVAERLRARGHAVYTPTQTGLGERRHLLSRDISMDVFVNDIVNVLEAEELRNVYLVGHSFGGGTVAGVADRVPDRLKRLVFLDAGIPQGGKSSFDRLPPEVRDARIKAADETSGGLSIPVPPVSTFGLKTEEDQRWVERRMTPHPLNTYMTAPTIEHPIGNGVATTYIRCTDPFYSNVAPSAEFAKAQGGWQYLEIQTGHDAMVSAPAELCELLCGLA